MGTVPLSVIAGHTQEVLEDLLRRVNQFETVCRAALTSSHPAEDRLLDVAEALEILAGDLEHCQQEALDSGILDTFGHPVPPPDTP